MHDSYQHETFRLETEHWWYRARRKIILSHFRRRFQGRRDLRILDIGCGAGSLLSYLGQFGEAMGLDESADATQEARKHSSSSVWTGSFPDGLPDNCGTFDATCLFDVIEHIEDDVATLRSARQLLNEDGTLFVTVPALPWLFGIHDEINEHHRRYTRTTLTHALQAAGFGRIRVSYFNTLLSPLLIPVICWRNRCRRGHHFELCTRFSPLLEQVLSFEQYLMKFIRLPFGLSLLAVAERGGAYQSYDVSDEQHSLHLSEQLSPGY